MRFVVSLSLIVFGVVVTGCASKKTFKDTGVSASQSNAMSMRVNWVKDKGKKFDLEVAVTNELAAPVIVFLKDIRCARGNANGELRHTFFNTGERTIDFHPRESKIFRMVCVTGHTDGPYQLEIGRVFSNPTGDGKNADKVIGKSIAWSGADR